MKKASQDSYQIVVSRQRWLSGNVFEVGFERPAGFAFIPGQKVRLTLQDITREYTLINHPDASELTICVRHVAEGRFTPLLARARIGESFSMSSATGFFTYQSTTRAAVFVATGAGISPFLAFIRAGVRDFSLVHGARTEEDLLYREEVSVVSREYIPCLSASKEIGPFRSGHVTAYLENSLAEGTYDFYLCGNGNMVRNAIRIIDRRFLDSKVFIETFF